MSVPVLTLRLTPQELDFIAQVLAQVAYGTVVNANMTHLIPKIREQVAPPPVANDARMNGLDPEDTLKPNAN